MLDHITVLVQDSESLVQNLAPAEALIDVAITFDKSLPEVSVKYSTSNVFFIYEDTS
jgi:hypothetical protein